MTRVTPFSMSLQNGINARGLDARDGNNKFSLLDISGPKAEMDKMFGPPGKLDTNALNKALGGNGNADGKGGANGQGQGQGQDHPFSELANLFGKDSPIGKFLHGIGQMLGGQQNGDNKGLPNSGGNNSSQGANGGSGGNNSPQGTNGGSGTNPTASPQNGNSGGFDFSKLFSNNDSASDQGQPKTTGTSTASEPEPQPKESTEKL